jgi:hypothetical protein
MWWGVVVPARPPGNSMVFLLVSFVRHRNPGWLLLGRSLFLQIYSGTCRLEYGDFGRNLRKVKDYDGCHN